MHAASDREGLGVDGSRVKGFRGVGFRAPGFGGLGSRESLERGTQLCDDVYVNCAQLGAWNRG